MSEERDMIIRDFKQAVNLTPKQLQSWLDTDDSKEVGQKNGNDESIGHKSGKYVVELLQKQSDHSEDDIVQMQRVISYVKRHSAQRPSGDVKNTHWRFSLMNWGHDPLVKG